MTETEIDMGLTWEECGGYVPAMQRGPQDTAQTEMQRLLELSAQQAADNDRLRGVLETVRDKLRVDDPHELYDLVCNSLRPNVKVTGLAPEKDD